MARRKKKLNRGLLIALCSAAGLFVIGVALLLAYKFLPRDASKYYRRAQTATSEGNRRDAYAQYKTAIRHSRDDIDTNQQYRMELVAFLDEWLDVDEELNNEMRGRIKGEWRNQLEAVLQDDANNLDARSMLTEYYWNGSVQAGEREPAWWDLFLKSAEAQTRLTPDDAELYYRIASAYATLSRNDQSHYSKAMTYYALAVNAAPADSTYYLGWVGYLMQQKGIKARLDTLAPAGNTSVDTLVQWIASIAEARQAKIKSASPPRRAQAAIERLSPRDVYQLGLASNAKSVRLRVALAEYLYFAKDPDAEAQFQQALAIEVKDARDMMAIAVYCVRSAGSFGSERTDQALEYYAMARQADPALMDAAVGQVQLHLTRREYAEAEQICRDTLKTLEAKRAGRDLKDMAREEASEYVSAMIHLNVSLARSLLGILPDDPAQREQTLTEIRQYLSSAGEYLPSIEDGVRPGVAGNVQRQATKIRARLALLAGEEFEAEKLYRMAFDASPSIDLETVTALVNLYLRHGQESEALRMLQMVTQVFPKEASAWLLAAQLHLAQRHMTSLEEAVQKLESLDLTERQVATLEELRNKASALQMQLGAGVPEADMPAEVTEAEVPKWLAYAQRLLDDQEPQEAIKVIQKLHLQFPANEYVVASLVQMYLSEDNSDEALQTLDRALAANPDSARLAFLREVVSTPRESRDEVYIKYVTEHEEGIRRELSLARFYQGKTDDADLSKFYEHMERAVAIDPAAQNCLFRLFTIYLADDKIAEAEKLAVRAAELDLEGTGGKVFRAQVLIAKEQWDEAIVVLQEAIAMRPRFALAYALLGEAYLNNGQLAEAEDSFNTSYGYNSRDVRSLIGLARIADTQKRTDDHRRWIFAAYPHAPTVPYVRRHWLRYRKDLVTPEQFLRDCISLYRRYPHDMEVVLMLASAYEKLARPDYEKAEEIYRKSYEHLKETDEGVRHLGMLMLFLQRIGKVAEAEALLDESAATTKDRLKHRLLRVQLLLAAKRFSEARLLIDQLCQEYPEDPRPFQFLAQWAIDSGEDWPAGVRAMKTVIRLKPGDSVYRQHYFEMLMRAGMYDEAIAELSGNIEQNPNDDEAMALLAHAYHIMGRTDEAMAMCSRAITTNPKQIRARVLRSDMLFAAGQIESSILDLEEAYKNRPSEAIALLLANRLYEADPDGTRAKAVLVEALSVHKESIRLLRRLGEIHLATRDWQGLDEVVAQGRRADPRSVVWPVFEAEMFKALGKADKRAAALKEAYDLDPTSLPVTLDYLDALLEIEQYGQVLDVVSRVRNAPRDAMVRLQAAAGCANFKMGNTADGLRDLQTSLASGRSITTIKEVAGRFYYALGDRQGVELLTKWVANNTLPGPRMALATKLIEFGQLDGAAQALGGADRTDASPDQKLWILRTLGELQYRLKRYQESRQSYERALAMAEDAYLLNNLAYMLAEDLNDPQAALPYAERAAKLDPSDANMADTLGWIYFRAGQPENAETQLNRSLSLKQTSAAFYHLGSLYESMGKMGQAAEMYRDGRDLVKDNPDDPFYDLLQKKRVQR